MIDRDLKMLENRYEFITELGRGGVSIVYKAKDKTLDRLVALKTLSTKILSEKQLIQFQTEAKALSGLKHKGIMEILDFGSTEDGIPYMVLEFVDGIPLSKHIENVGPLPLTLCLSTFSQLCEALNHAHNKGVLHRDIKPSNIILVSAKDGGYIPKLIDFGLAVLGKDVNSANAGTGSPPYMSPEQVDGAELDQRSDIYSLGCTIFESLTGKVPYSGASAFETMNMHKNAPLPRLGQLSMNDDIQSGLQNLIDKAMSKSKDSRFQFVLSMQKSIEQILEEQIEFSRKKDELKAHPEFSVKSKRIIWLVIACLLLPVAAIGTYYIYNANLEIFKKEKPIDDAHIAKRTKEESSSNQSMSRAKTMAGARLDDTKSKMPDLASYPLSSVKIDWQSVDVSNFDFTSLKKFPRLKKLVIKLCDITPKQLEQICTLDNIVTLELNGEYLIRNEDFSSIHKMKNLKNLHLPCSNIQRKGLVNISKLKNLVDLSIEQNSAIDDEIMDNLLAMPHLKTLKIGINPGFNQELLQKLGKFSQLEELNMDALDLNDSIAEYLSSRLLNMKELSVGHSLITVKGVRALLKLPKLEYLNISGCKYLQDESALESIEILSRTFKRVKISDRSRMFKD